MDALLTYVSSDTFRALGVAWLVLMVVIALCELLELHNRQ